MWWQDEYGKEVGRIRKIKHSTNTEQTEKKDIHRVTLSAKVVSQNQILCKYVTSLEGWTKKNL